MVVETLSTVNAPIDESSEGDQAETTEEME
jgi:hypothetical protein